MTLCRNDEAIAAFERSIALSPQYVKAYNNLGNVLARVGRYGDAVAAFTRALELQPDYSRGWSNFAAVLTQKGRQEEALAAECQKRVEAAIERYLATPPRTPDTMFDHLYAELPRSYAGQRRELGGSDA